MTYFDDIFPKRQPGIIVVWPGISKEPDNKYFLECDGVEFDISLPENSQYIPLFNTISNIYGGDGINTFRIPDYRNRYLRHRSLTVDIGTEENGGLKNHTHTINSNITFRDIGQNVYPSNSGSYRAGGCYGLTSSAQSIGRSTSTTVGGNETDSIKPKTLNVRFYISY